MKHRLFAAIEMNEEVKDYLFNLSKELELDAKIKWVAKKNLHLTLKFLGYVEDTEKVAGLLNNVKFNAFEFSLKCLGVFDLSRPRVLFADVSPVNDVLELQFKIESELKEMFETDESFSTHITIGRIKSLKDKNKFLEIIKRFKVEEMKINVNAFYLFESQLSKDGPKYRLIREFKAN